MTGVRFMGSAHRLDDSGVRPPTGVTVYPVSERRVVV